MNDKTKEEDEELNLRIAISPSVDVRLGTLVNATVVIIDSSKTTFTSHRQLIDLVIVFLYDTALPQIITHPSNITVKVNNDTTNIQLQCTTSETNEYRWEKQDGAVLANAEGVDSNTLTLIGVTPGDSGLYRCVAINDHGRSYSNYATVTVKGKHTNMQVQAQIDFLCPYFIYHW